MLSGNPLESSDRSKAVLVLRLRKPRSLCSDRIRTDKWKLSTPFLKLRVSAVHHLEAIWDFLAMLAKRPNQQEPAPVAMDPYGTHGIVFDVAVSRS